jgi:hypothetical protein
MLSPLGKGNCGNKEQNGGAVEDETCFHGLTSLSTCFIPALGKGTPVRSFHRGAAGAGDDRTSTRRARRDRKYNFNVAGYNERTCG